MPNSDLRALVFDVQGTLLDFYTPVASRVREAFERCRVPLEVDGFVSAWRGAYFEGMRAVTEGARPWVPTATIYREGLDRLLAEGGADGAIDEATRSWLGEAWTRLVPWPDTVDGLRRLRRRFILVALTNGGLGATVALCARHDLAFHAVVTTDLVRTFKPDPATYALALRACGIGEGEAVSGRAMMVASHPYDLEAAHAQGMRAAFVDRPNEYGPHRRNQAVAPACCAMSVADLSELASGLDA